MTSTARKIITSLAVAGAAAAISVGGASTASAQQYGSLPAVAGRRPVHADPVRELPGPGRRLGDRRRREVQAGPQRRGRRQHREPGEHLGDGTAQRVRQLPRPGLLLGVRPEHRHQEHRRHPATAHRLRVLGQVGSAGCSCRAEPGSRKMRTTPTLPEPPMARTLADRLGQARARSFVGRPTELDQFAALITPPTNRPSSWCTGPPASASRPCSGSSRGTRPRQGTDCLRDRCPRSPPTVEALEFGSHRSLDCEPNAGRSY